MECDGSGNISAYSAWLAAHANATASDVCGGAITWSYVEGDWVADCGITKHRTVTFFASDACGNTSTGTGAVFTIEDTQEPEWDPTSLPGNLEFLCGEPVVFDYPVADDGCDDDPDVVCWRSDNLLCSDPYPQGITTVTFQAVDACGNSSTEYSITITVETGLVCDDIEYTLNGEYGLVFCGMQGNSLAIDIPPDFEPVQGIVWHVDGDWEIVSVSQDFHSIIFNANDDLGVTFTITITDVNGCIKTCEKRSTAPKQPSTVPIHRDSGGNDWDRIAMETRRQRSWKTS